MQRENVQYYGDWLMLEFQINRNYPCYGLRVVDACLWSSIFICKVYTKMLQPEK